MTEINTKYTKDFIPLKMATNALLHMVRFVQSILFLISLDFYAMRKIECYKKQSIWYTCNAAVCVHVINVNAEHYWQNQMKSLYILWFQKISTNLQMNFFILQSAAS